MLKEEADWIRSSLERLKESQSIFPIGNIGSSVVGNLRDESWLPALMDFLKNRGDVYNVDIKDHPTIDFIGDLRDEAFVERLSKVGFGLVMCCNVLTCIDDVHRFADSLLKVAPAGSYLLVTASRRYPYVADPIDTLFRPTPQELAKLFPNTVVVEECAVESQSYFRILVENPRLLSLTVLRAMLPIYKPDNWFKLVKYFPKMLKPVSTSCVLLKKVGPSEAVVQH